MSEFLEPLLRSASDPAIERAAAGLRPVLGADAPLPATKVRFEPDSFAYKVNPYGGGTLVYMYGTDEFGHSVMVRASGFYAYLYVELVEGVEPRQLVNELNSTILLSLALDSKKWAPERRAAMATVVGKLRRVSACQAKIEPGKRDPRSMPIVGYEIVPASIMRGHGGDFGYRGIEQRMMLKIYFYSPGMLTRARSLMHGKNAHLPMEEQAKALSRTPFKKDETIQAKAEHNEQQSIKKWIKHVDDAEEESDENPDVAAAVYQSLPDNADELFERIDEANDNNDDDEPNEQAGADEWKNADADDDQTEIDGQVAHGANSYQVLEAKLEQDFLDIARRYARALRGPAGLLSRLSEEHPLKVCDADIEFVLRFCIDCHISPSAWVEVDSAAVTLTPDSFREPLRNNRAHSADGGHAGYPNSTWMLDRTPPGVEPFETTVRRITPRRTERDRLDTESHAQIELWTDFHNIRPVADENVQATVRQCVRLSFDCEMETGPNNSFPKPEDQQVLNVGIAIPLPPRLKSKKKWRLIVFAVGQIASDVERADAEEHSSKVFKSALNASAVSM